MSLLAPGIFQHAACRRIGEVAVGPPAGISFCRADREPFRPFKLETTGGKQIEILTRDHLLFAPESRDLIIAFEPGGRMHLLSTDQLASLDVEMPGE